MLAVRSLSTQPLLSQGSYKTLPGGALELGCDPVQGCVLSSTLDGSMYMARPALPGNAGFRGQGTHTLAQLTPCPSLQAHL